MGNSESTGLKGMCCNNAFCAQEADVENFEAKQPPRLAENPTQNTHATSNQRKTGQ